MLDTPPPPFPARRACLLEHGCSDQSDQSTIILLDYRSSLPFIQVLIPLFFFDSDNDGKVEMKFDVLGEGEVSVPTHFFKVIAIFFSTI